MRISIDKKWTAEEFQTLFAAVEQLYLFLALNEDHLAVIEMPEKLLKREAFERFKRASERGNFQYALGYLIAKLEAAGSPEEFEEILSGKDVFFQRSRGGYFTDEIRDFFLDLAVIDRSQIEQASRYRSRTRDWRSAALRGGPPKILVQARLQLPHRLEITRIEFASPGFTDLAGIGQIIGHLKDILFKIIDVYSSKGERAARTAILNEQLEEVRINNVGKKLDLLRRMGYSDEICQRLAFELAPSLGFIEDAVHRGLITSVSSDADG